MKTMNWTEQKIDNFLSKITFDFITQLEKKMESLPMSQAELAEKLNLSESRVSQILNGSHNLELKSIIKYARALGLKVAVIAYDDDDPDNNRGLINSEIFSACWERQGKPADFFALENSQIQKIESVKTNEVLDLDIVLANRFSATRLESDVLSTYKRVVGEWKLWKEAKTTTSVDVVSGDTEEIARAVGA
jgi:transcriptional regulator with XRE-family HTH domain